jgi:hypothetical protein
MKDKIRIKFVDFWPGFIPEESYFYEILGGDPVIVLSEDPQILFFSNFGSEHLSYQCFKVFFSSENERPDFLITDIALTFDFNTNKRHFRLPLYILYAHQYGYNLKNLLSEIPKINFDEWSKRKFCCLVVSNGKSKHRINVFKFLQNLEQIDSGGRYLNNVGGPVEDKLKFIEDYKFVISFENSKHPGYTTEKILEPMLVNSIPIYWGNPVVRLDFNPNSFIDSSDFKNILDLYRHLKRIEKEPQTIEKILNSEKIIRSNNFLYPEMIKEFILYNYLNTPKVVSQKKMYRFFSKLMRMHKTIKYWFVEFTFGHYR